MGKSRDKYAAPAKRQKRVTQNQHKRDNFEPPRRDMRVTKAYADLHGHTLEEDISEYLNDAYLPR